MVAIVRNEDAGVFRRLENGGARGHGDRVALDPQVDQWRVRHQATAALVTGTLEERLPEMSASNSWRNFCSPLTTGAAHESLSTQIVFPVMFSAIASNVSKSSNDPWPATMRSR